MATPSKKGKYSYEGNDLVDEFLFNLVTNHVNIDIISLFGLKFGEDLPIDPLAAEDQVQQVNQIPSLFMVKYFSLLHSFSEKMKNAVVVQP